MACLQDAPNDGAGANPSGGPESDEGIDLVERVTKRPRQISWRIVLAVTKGSAAAGLSLEGTGRKRTPHRPSFSREVCVFRFAAAVIRQKARAPVHTTLKFSAGRDSLSKDLEERVVLSERV